jgi:hypothetical protein
MKLVSIRLRRDDSATLTIHSYLLQYRTSFLALCWTNAKVDTFANPRSDI